ncbi:serine protease inhibitor dipetalogastin-like [Ostrea edulis]|uniref:serine protease inhibitor dipetalogastin-like n=1 Tax=Ostrea edulis TaxID=37623 RepID=UPI0024AF03D0|nr:serine protease inhibitor dipetalogastin-like [Ostrea edulis]
MDISVITQVLFILMSLLLHCKSNNVRWKQNKVFLKCLEQTIEKDCKPLSYLDLVFNDVRDLWNKRSYFQLLNQKWNRKWRQTVHKKYMKNRKFYRKFSKSLACLWRSARTCGMLTNTGLRKLQNRLDCLWRSGRVCGADGKTYKNACHAARLGVNVQYRGKCSSEWMLGERVPLCYDLPCLCKITREPDACCFKNVKRKECEDILSKWESFCNGTSNCRCDFCDNNYSPVCSVKGNTFDNLCKMGCIDGEEFACNGTCPCPSSPGPTVCGTDGLTYSSPNEALKRNVGISCDAPCPCSSDCTCDDTLDPVCGEDDVTYDNACKAKCSDVSIACNISCPCPMTPCQCDNEADPVCGSDAKTYLNRCRAECADVEIACETCCPCPEIQAYCTYCNYEFNFVCGHDNVTYANECCADCA